MSERILSAKTAIDLLKAVGVQVAEITDNEEAADKEVTIDELLGEIDKTRTPVIKNKLEPSIKETLETEITGRMMGTARAAIKRLFNVEPKDIKDLDIEPMLKFALDKYSMKFSKDTESIREEMKAMADGHEEEKRKLTEDWEAKERQAIQRYVERDIDMALLEVVKAIPRSGGDELFQTKQFKEDLRNQFHIVFNEKENKVELRQKDNPEAFAINGNQLVDISEVAKGHFKKAGVLMDDMRDVNPKNASDHSKSGEPILPSKTDLHDGMDDVSLHIQTLLED